MGLRPVNEGSTDLSKQRSVAQGRCQPPQDDWIAAIAKMFN